MKLFEMSRAPQRAGVAILNFGATDTPKRQDGGVILLPNKDETEFFPIKGGQQFLLRTWGDYDGRISFRYWFCGTEENPFVVQITVETFNAFKRGGEAEFFAALKPKAVTKCEETFQVTACPAYRQAGGKAISLRCRFPMLGTNSTEC